MSEVFLKVWILRFYDSKEIITIGQVLTLKYHKLSILYVNLLQYTLSFTCDSICQYIFGGAVAQSVEHATSVEEVPGSIPAVAARSLLVGSVSV